MDNNFVLDAGTTEEIHPRYGIPHSIVSCPRVNNKNHSENCPICGGNGQRRICNLTKCYEHGCQGDGYCDDLIKIDNSK